MVLLVGVSSADRLPIMVLEFMAGRDLYTLIHDPSRSVWLFVNNLHDWYWFDDWFISFGECTLLTFFSYSALIKQFCVCNFSL